MNEALALLLALVAGTVLGFWISRASSRARADADAARLREVDDRLRTTEAARETARAELGTAQQRLAQL